ncbi:MAG: DUF1653 domain-containing protein [Alistipes sp.]|nr:DUF1653 domain-containing protein [Alistipes sp.]
MTNAIPAPGEFYRHFKNKYYQVLAVATHSETKEKLVVYQALYDDFGVYARPLSMFVSEVDHEKYPEVKQKFRFEKIDKAELKKMSKTSETVPKKTEDRSAVKDEERETDEFVDKVFHRKKEVKKEVYLEGPDQPSPILMEFLDLRTMDAKVRFLSDNKKKLTNEIINAMAASIDVTVPDGPLELRYSSLRSCLQTKAKYEINRLR